MALPTLKKTWEVDPNNVGGSSVAALEDHQRTLYAIKEALIGGGSAEIATAPWTVALSSDGSSAGASDYWLDYLDLVWSTGAHAWIVLECGGSIGFQICIDLDNAGAWLLDSVYWSPSGVFAGGDVNNRPTAVDELPLEPGPNYGWCGAAGSTITTKVHVAVSDDGDATNVIVYNAGKVNLFWRFEIVEDPVPGWTDGIFIRLYGSPNTATHATDFAQMASGSDSHCQQGGAAFQPFISYEAYKGTEVFFGVGQTTPNDFDSSNPMGPMGLWSEDVSYRGRVGTLADLWWGLTVRADGDQYPDVGTTKQFTQVGDIIVPWDSSTVMQTV